MEKLFRKKNSNKVNIITVLPRPRVEFLAYHDHDTDTASLSSQALSDVPSEVIIKSRIKYGSRLSACKGILMEYSHDTTIHGLRYIVAIHRPWYEKIFWLIFTVVSFYLAFSLMWHNYLKWQDSPVILVFDETLVPVHEIPFPTITICPEIKMDHNIFNFSSTSEKILQRMQRGNIKNINLTEEDIQRFASLLHICEAEIIQRFGPQIPKNIQTNIAQVMVNISVTKKETALVCKWNGRTYFGQHILNFVATDEGICYQFNGLQSKDLYRNASFLSYYDSDVVDFSKDFNFRELPPLNNLTGSWSLDSGYQRQGYNAYPQRTVFSSASNGFFAVLQGFEHNLDYTCRAFKQGYKVYLNSPESVPLTSGNYILVPHGNEVLVRVLPQYVKATTDLRSFKPAKRQCYFDDERYLRYFRLYSQSNCQTECLTNYTIVKCGCAKFWMPKPLSVRVCGIADINCYTRAQTELNIVLQNQAERASFDANVKIMCDCMPACISLDYNFEISISRFEMAKVVEAFRDVYTHADYLGSRLSVYFKENQFTAIKRTVIFSLTNLIANCGGLFGLFLGISSFSLIEFIYFFTVHLIKNVHKRHETKKELIKQENFPKY